MMRIIFAFVGGMNCIFMLLAASRGDSWYALFFLLAAQASIAIAWSYK